MSLSTPFIHRPIATMLLTLALALVGALAVSLPFALLGASKKPERQPQARQEPALREATRGS